MIWFWISAGSAALLIGTFFLLAMGYRRAKRTTYPALAEPVHVSVIVAARNEEANLPALFAALRAQTYPHSYIHLILANDRSTDDTYRIARDTDLDGISTQIVNITEVPDGVSPKKYALARAIELATTDFLLFTDADCVPQPGWVEAHARALQSHDVVLGRAPLVEEFKKDAEEFATYFPSLRQYAKWATGRATTPAAEFAVYEGRRTEFLLFGAAGLGMPYMSLGRNWSYRKSVYSDAGGLEPLFKHLGGDDDLLLQRFKRNGASIGVMMEPNSAVRSVAPHTLRALFRQKRRHYSVSGHYALSAKLALGGMEFLPWVCIISAIMAIFTADLLWNVYAIAIPLVLFYSLNAMVNLVPRTRFVYAEFQWEIVRGIFSTITGIAGLVRSRDW